MEDDSCRGVPEKCDYGAGNMASIFQAEIHAI